jgi:WD40 repeat protein
MYDGTVAVFSPQLKKLGSFVADEEPLKSCQFVPSEKENNYYCLTGGYGELLQVHLVSLVAKGIESTLISSNAHEGSINSIGVSPGSDMHVATGGSEGKLSIWQIPSDFDAVGSHNSVKSKKKKVELTLNALPKLASESIHKGTIEYLAWITDQEVVSSSSDHQIGITDVVKMSRAETILTRDSVVTSIDTHGVQILSAHEDGQIRLWDRRDPSRPTNTYKTHSKWASCVRFNNPAHIFASGSYDHTVKIWDSRCGFPMQNLHSKE